MKLVVIGGGISGTAAAWTAAREAEAAGVRLEVLLLERDAEPGGKAKTIKSNGWLLETGPLGFLGTEPSVARLAAQVGMADRIESARPAAAHRYIVRGGVMSEIPTNPVKFFFSNHMKPSSTLRILREPFVRTPPESDDESVHDFFARRFGAGVAERLVHPMILGIWAGDSKQLSMRAAFPLLTDLEDESGSVIKGFLGRAKEKKREGNKTDKTERGLKSFRDGVQSLPRALADSGTYRVRCSTQVLQLSRSDDRMWKIVIGGGEMLAADSVICTTEAFYTADLIRSESEPLADELTAISYPPVAVVGLGYSGADAAKIPDGFGVLIPRDDRYRMLGVTWDGRVFPNRNPDGSVLVRVMLGGTFDPAIGKLDEEEIASIAHREMTELTGVSARPAFSHVRLWKHAIPQYDVGHLARVRRVEKLIDTMPGLFLGGNSLYGSSFGKSAARGIAVGRESAAWLGAKQQ